MEPHFGLGCDTPELLPSIRTKSPHLRLGYGSIALRSVELWRYGYTTTSGMWWSRRSVEIGNHEQTKLIKTYVTPAPVILSVGDSPNLPESDKRAVMRWILPVDGNPTVV